MPPSSNPIKASIASVTDPSLSLEKGQIPQTPLKHTIRLDPKQRPLGPPTPRPDTRSIPFKKKHSKSSHPDVGRDPGRGDVDTRPSSPTIHSGSILNCKMFPRSSMRERLYIPDISAFLIYSIWLLTLVSFKFLFYRRSLKRIKQWCLFLLSRWYGEQRDVINNLIYKP